MNDITGLDGYIVELADLTNTDIQYDPDLITPYLCRYEHGTKGFRTYAGLYGFLRELHNQQHSAFIFAAIP
jgi:hypothetical protein